MMVAAILEAMASPVAAEQTADARWNGVWREVPERSRLFYPGSIRVEPGPPGAYRIVGGDEDETFRCDGGRRVDPAGVARTCTRVEGRLQAHREQPGPRRETTTWTFAPGRAALTVEHRVETPSGAPMRDVDVYSKAGSSGPLGEWRKVRSTETPTVYALTLDGSHLHVRADGGLLDFRSPLLGRAPTTRDRREGDHVYGVLVPRRIVELSFRGDRPTGRSDLKLSPDGASFVERHVDARGRSVSVFFRRVGPPEPDR